MSQEIDDNTYVPVAPSNLEVDATNILVLKQKSKAEEKKELDKLDEEYKLKSKTNYNTIINAMEIMIKKRGIKVQKKSVSTTQAILDFTLVITEMLVENAEKVMHHNNKTALNQSHLNAAMFNVFPSEMAKTYRSLLTDLKNKPDSLFKTKLLELRKNIKANNATWNRVETCLPYSRFQSLLKGMHTIRCRAGDVKTACRPTFEYVYLVAHYYIAGFVFDHVLKLSMAEHMKLYRSNDSILSIDTVERALKNSEFAKFTKSIVFFSVQPSMPTTRDKEEQTEEQQVERSAKKKQKLDEYALERITKLPDDTLMNLLSADKLKELLAKKEALN
jgi:hypothetical protein